MDEYFESLSVKIALVTTLIGATTTLFVQLTPYGKKLKKILKDIKRKSSGSRAMGGSNRKSQSMAYYEQLGREYAKKYNECVDNIGRENCLLEFAKKYVGTRKRDWSNSDVLLEVFRGNVDVGKASQHKLKSITYPEMLFNILTIKKFPAHFEGFKKSLFGNVESIESIERYYGIIECLLIYERKSVDAAVKQIEMMSTENMNKKCLFYLLVGAFLYRKRDGDGQYDRMRAVEMYDNGIKDYRENVACQHCVAKCNKKAIYVELLRGLAAIKRLEIDCSSKNTMEEGYRVAADAFKKALAALRFNRMPDKKRVKADVCFSYGYLSFIYFFRLAYKFGDEKIQYLKRARRLFQQSNELRKTKTRSKIESRLAVISYYLKEIEKTKSIVQQNLDYFEVERSGFIAGESGVENNLNIIWVYYLLALADPGGFRKKITLKKNIAEHIHAVFDGKKLTKGPLECHGLDLLIVDKIQKDKYPGIKPDPRALETFEKFAAHYNTAGYKNDDGSLKNFEELLYGQSN